MRKIFINYRRRESLKDARHLASLLEREFGRSGVFIDLKGLDGAPDWLHELERQVASSDVVLAVIGDGWADVRDDEGNRRLDNDKDFVRFEIAEAFRRNIPVVPVLVDGAALPRLKELPENIWWLTRPQTEVLRAESFDADVAKIAARVRRERERRRPVRRGVPMWATSLALMFALALGLAAAPAVLPLLGLDSLVRTSLSSDEMAVRLTTAEGALKRAFEARDFARDEATEVKKQLVTAEKARKAAEDNVERARAETAQANEARDKTAAERKRLETELATKAADVTKLRAALDTEIGRRTPAETSLKASQRELEVMRDALARAMRESDVLKQKLADADKARFAAEAERAELLKRLANLQVAATRAQDDLGMLRERLASADKARRDAEDAQVETAKRLSRSELLLANRDASLADVAKQLKKSQEDVLAVRERLALADKARMDAEAARDDLAKNLLSLQKLRTTLRDPALPITPGSTVSFRDSLKDGKACDFCPEMVVVPASSFVMGSPESEKDRDTDEGPQRRVTFAKPFAVGRHPVTRGQFRAFVTETKRTMIGGCRILPATSTDWKLESDKSWEAAGFAQDDKHPVVCVNWKDASDFSAWLSEKTGRDYRLSEAEREYVTRAGTATRYHFGDSIDESQANYNRKKGGTTPIGRYPANAWGLHDVHGNVLDWTADCRNRSYVDAPADGSAWVLGDCDSRIQRGGAWPYGPGGLRSAFRYFDPSDRRQSDAGFRVARSLTP